MSGEDAGWCTIESDPGVFTALLESFGVEDVQVEELYSLDRESITQLEPIYGLVFLFKYRADERVKASSRPGKLCQSIPDGVFFAQQVIQNACATQAILSIVLNCKGMCIGPELTQFREFSAGMDPATIGMVISNSEVIRAAHNFFAPQQQFVLEDLQKTEKEDAFHFVSYLPINGRVYELDGLQSAPRDHGACGGDSGDWLDIVTGILQQRIEEYSDTEIRFNLMAITEDRKKRAEKDLSDARAEGKDAEEISAIEARLMQASAQREQWAKENARRRWNFVPFIINALKLLASEGHIENAIEEASEKKKRAIEEFKAKQKADETPEA